MQILALSVSRTALFFFTSKIFLASSGQSRPLRQSFPAIVGSLAAAAPPLRMTSHFGGRNVAAFCSVKLGWRKRTRRSFRFFLRGFLVS